MAFFKFRKDSDDHPAPAPVTESVETMRRRARYRLVGASILVLAGVVGFPVLFDNQPRPISVDIPIEIPDKAKVQAPVNVATVAKADKQGAEASAPVVAPVSTGSAPAANPTEKRVASGAVAPAPPAAEVKAAKPVQKTEEIISPPATKPNDGAKAQALLDNSPAPASATRYVVQFGAFSDAAKAHETRMKVEKAGIKTYAQMVQGPDGKKFRVRVGPFETKADAVKAAEKIKKLDLPVTILEL